MKTNIRHIWKALAIGACIGLAQVSNTAFADGTETLGPPSIDISSGSGIVAAGTGLQSLPGTININVPGTVNQALLYWEIADTSTTLAGSDLQITVDGTVVTGTNIGGPVGFVGDTINQYTLRADITGLVSSGVNNLILTAPGGDLRNDGASVLVIFDDGSEAVVDIRDGHDYVYANSAEGGSYLVSVPQTFTFDPAVIARTATFALIGGLGEEGRGDITRITVNGTTTDFPDEFRGQDGAEQSTVIIPVNVPANDTSVTVQIISTDPNPDSIAWAAAGLSVRPPPEPGIDIEKLTNGNQADGADDSDVPQIATGNVVAWRYEVTNTGNVAFSEAELTVTDDTPGVTPVLDTSSDDGDLILSPLETWIYTAMGQALDLLQTPPAGVTVVDGCNDDRPTYENMGQVVTDPFNLMDTDPSHYCNPPQGGGEGCTPGYWKQRHHFDSWVVFDPSDDYETVFGVDASFNKTLLGALKQGGGGEKALGRHAVAALLNTSNSDVSYAFTTDGVIAIVQNAYATGNFGAAKNLLEAENEQGCPLN